SNHLPLLARPTLIKTFRKPVPSRFRKLLISLTDAEWFSCSEKRCLRNDCSSRMGENFVATADSKLRLKYALRQQQLFLIGEKPLKIPSGHPTHVIRGCVSQPPTRVRWRIMTYITAVQFITYLDRLNLSIAGK